MDGNKFQAIVAYLQIAKMAQDVGAEGLTKDAVGAASDLFAVAVSPITKVSQVTPKVVNFEDGS